MNKGLMIGGGAVAALLVGLLVAVSMQPSEVHVERSRVIAASPDEVWPLVSDLRAFVTWSPWEGRDPDQVAEFSDPSSGVGAWYTWSGNDDVGVGRMAITAVEPPTRVVEDLEFHEPWESRAEVTLLLEPDPGGTKVTWGFDTEVDLMGKVGMLFMDMDAMLGPDFEQGLENLDREVLAHAAAQAEPPPTDDEGAAVTGPDEGTPPEGAGAD